MGLDGDVDKFVCSCGDCQGRKGVLFENVPVKRVGKDTVI